MHGMSGGAACPLAQDDLPQVVRGILRLRPGIGRRVESALFWLRESEDLVLGHYRNNVLRVYSSHWNAFECLVEATILARPISSLSKQDKQRQIDEFVTTRGGHLTAADILKCFQEIVNPGFVGKASHALRICFGDGADHYINECFRIADRKNRLYDIRNSINHGEVDALDPEELIRIESRLVQLKAILRRMFSHLVFYAVDANSGCA